MYFPYTLQFRSVDDTVNHCKSVFKYTFTLCFEQPLYVNSTNLGIPDLK